AAADLSAQYAARNVQVVVFELGNSTDNIIANASQYNLTNTEDTCLQFGSSVGDALSNIPLVGDELGEAVNKLIGSNPKGKCEDPANHVFWDAVHPTTRMHALLAEAFVTDMRQLGWWT
ncbi:thermolabile hemolysin, partial [Haematococcus lacustris]